MDIMETYKIRALIQDAIRSLDSSPMRWDLVYEMNAVQLTNRAPQVHLAIEQGLKILLHRAGKPQEQTRPLGHSLNKLYRSLKECDAESATFLETAFQDTVKFYGYNVKVKGFGHFQSLYQYLSEVGTDAYFQRMRYWILEDDGQDGNPIPVICLRTHRELLCALSGLFSPTPTHETVTERVEEEIWRVLTEPAELAWASDDTHKENLIKRYLDWLNNHESSRSALEEVLTEKSIIDADNEFTTEVVRKAYRELQRSEDPAVLYYTSTLSYLPRGSQCSGANPEIEWVDRRKRWGKVVTPSGTCLGFIRWYPNNSWGIEPLESGLAGTKAIALSDVDAAHFLIKRLTRQAIVTANGTSKAVRLVTGGRHIASPLVWTRDVDDLEGTYDLEFWDDEHGLRVGNECTIKIPSDYNPHSSTVLEGIVTVITEQKVVIHGPSILTFAKRISR